ncbi:MAG TPA: hypothetical protein VEG34_05535 [Thermoanaerobaculia bacterium]|nr:hypothetical protein [Thermoanaerobaculia bacterium]
MSDLFDFFSNIQPFAGMNLLDWQAFRSEIWGWLIGASAVTAVAIVVLYVWHARRIRISRPMDPFLPFRPLRWLLLSVLPAVLICIVFLIRFQALFPFVVFWPIAGAVGTALFAGLATYAVAQLGIWLPWTTPAKFRYHPHWLWWLFQRGRLRRRSS